jgi:hypothetical protein
MQLSRAKRIRAAVRKRESRRHVNDCETSRSRLRCRRVLTCPVESKPNSRMIKTNTISVMLMASSIIDKKSPRRGWREEHRGMDLRRRTRRKSPSLSLGRLDLSSWYYLKHSKIDISQTREISCAMLWRTACLAVDCKVERPAFTTL